MPIMPELGDIYSNFFSDEHMCMRAAESDGAGRREGEEEWRNAVRQNAAGRESVCPGG